MQFDFKSLALQFSCPCWDTITEFFTDSYLVPFDVAKKYAGYVISAMGEDEDFLGYTIRPVFQGAKTPPTYKAVLNGLEEFNSSSRQDVKHFIVWHQVSEAAKEKCRLAHAKVCKKTDDGRFAVIVATEIELGKMSKTEDEIHLGVQFWRFTSPAMCIPNGDGSTAYFIELL